MNTLSKLSQILLTKKIEVGKYLQIPTPYLLRFNRYEGTRVGFGLETSSYFSKWLELGAYTGYGFRDDRFKYGGHLSTYFSREKDWYLKLSYQNDLTAPARSSYTYYQEPFQNWFSNRRDLLEEYKAEFFLRPFRFFQLSCFVKESQRTPSYPYTFSDEKIKSSTFTTDEVGIEGHYIFDARYQQIGRHRILSHQAFPIVRFYVSKAFANKGNGQFDFVKTEASIQHQVYFRKGNPLRVKVEAGMVNSSSAVPYFYLYNGNGSLFSNSATQGFVIENTFQTMGQFEFLSDQFVSLFMDYSIGKLVGNKPRYFKPELHALFNSGYGRLHHPEQQLNMEFSTMEKGFHEAGLLVKNLIRIPYMNIFYYSLGVGYFYRLGSYQNESTQYGSPKLLITISY